MNHMDVVPADPARWTVPPFSGPCKDGSSTAAAREDMKTEGILQLLAVVRARRERPCGSTATSSSWPPPTRRRASRARCGRSSPRGWRERLAKAEYLITEGGENLLDDRGRPVFFGVATGGEGAVLAEAARPRAPPGHGSRPIADSALNRLVRALDRVRLHRTAMKVLPSVAKFFRDQAAQRAEPRAGWYRDLAAAAARPGAAARTSTTTATSPRCCATPSPSPS